MTPSWYDVLDVDETATSAEIRTAWKAAIADLDPGERRFRLANQAAEVLLDPEKRAAHDEELAADADEPEVVPAPVVDGGGDVDADDDEVADEDEEADEDEDPDPAEPAKRAKTPPTTTTTTTTKTTGTTTVAPATSGGGSLLSTLPKAVLALAVVALVLVILTVVALVQGRDASAGADDGLPDAKRVQDARGAAEAAVVPVLAYDYRTLEEDQADARSYLTDDYAKEYDRFFAAAVETNAPRTKTVVRVRVLDSAIVRTGEDRVDVLLFVNRPTTNAQRSVEYRDQVTMRMLEVDGTWLVDCMITTGTGPCESD